MRVSAVVICAMKNTNVEIQLQPSMAHHTSSTDSLIVIKTSQRVIGLIEVKRLQVHTTLNGKQDAIAQVLREVHIVLCEDEQETIPFLFTNGQVWSFGVAKKCGQKIGVVSTSHIYSSMASVEAWKGIVHYVKQFLLEPSRLSLENTIT